MYPHCMACQSPEEGCQQLHTQKFTVSTAKAIYSAKISSFSDDLLKGIQLSPRFDGPLLPAKFMWKAGAKKDGSGENEEEVEGNGNNTGTSTDKSLSEEDDDDEKEEMKKEEKDKRLEGKSRGKHQESDTMHSAPSDKGESPREGSNNEGNGTSDEECVVTFNFSGNGEREEGSAEVNPKEVEEEEEPKQSEAQTTD